MVESVPFDALPGDRHTRFGKHAEGICGVVEFDLAAIALQHERFGDVRQGHAVELEAPRLQAFLEFEQFVEVGVPLLLHAFHPGSAAEVDTIDADLGHQLQVGGGQLAWMSN